MHMRTIFCLSTFLAGICSSLATRQEVLTHNQGSTSSRTGTLSLSSIQSTEHFTILNLPELPYHSVRIKKSNFCDPTVNVYTGYLDIDEGAKHLFFYFFESRRDPDNDDLMMWINGGPGCSSSMGLLMELGPCTIDMASTSSNRTTWNPYSWNNEANIFFLDQPVGVGFSYADYGESIGTTEDAAKNVHAFITIFLGTFGQFSKRPLHLAGESYAGRYLPLFASEIVDHNQRAALEGGSIINLKSVLIGNGLTDISTLYEGRFEVECGVASLDVPLQYISTCVRMKQALPRCQNMLDNACAKSFDSMNCRAAVVFCEDELSTGFWATGRNVYDMSKSCLGSDLCYFEIGNISSYLNLPSTRSLLGIETPQNFSSCSSKVGRLFDAHDDLSAVHTKYYVSGLLERGIRVLIYAGTYDWQCSWVSNKLWVERLQWSGQDEFNAKNWRGWKITDDGDDVGLTKTAGWLTFTTVYAAGHMVPHDKPLEALTMVSRWLADKDL